MQRCRQSSKAGHDSLDVVIKSGHNKSLVFIPINYLVTALASSLCMDASRSFFPRNAAQMSKSFPGEWSSLRFHFS